MGDGVLAYFGYPHAHEHDAERAVQAGLAIVEAAPKLETAARSPLHVRVGIATGLVVVGDLIGSGRRRSAASSARRRTSRRGCKAIAEPDTVVIAEGTRRLLGNLFELAGPRDEGPQGHRRAGAGLGGAAAEFRGEPLRGAAREPA